MNKSTNKVIKIVIWVLMAVLLGVGGYGIYTYLNREVDTTDYTVLEEITDFKYDEEIDYEYVEERITFSDKVEHYLNTMSNEEKVAKLFILASSEINDFTSFYNEYPISGIIVNPSNALLINNLVSNNELPLLKIANDYKDVVVLYSTLDETPMSIGISGDDDLNREYISDVSYSLKALGYNTVLAPNCNISTGDQEHDVDSYGSDGIGNVDMLETAIDTYKENNIYMIGNIFPYINQRETTIETLQQEDLMEFQCAIDNNVEAIMLSKEICQAITGSTSLPVFMSENTIDVLRAKMGFVGIIVSPDLYDYQSTECTYSEACIKAIKSGVDILYNPANFNQTYEDLLNAVNNGEISETRLDNAVGRILSMVLD